MLLLLNSCGAIVRESCFACCMERVFAGDGPREISFVIEEVTVCFTVSYSLLCL